MIFNERLKMLRQETGKSQEQTARSLGIALRNYQRLEADGNTPNFKTLVQIADMYEVSIDFLAGRTDYRNGPILYLSECGIYTYLNRLHWDERLRIEIIHGFAIQKLIPPTNHQIVGGHLLYLIESYVKEKRTVKFWRNLVSALLKSRGINRRM